ncbi:peptidylprolyl isomerase [Methylococcus sp. EFPC2]|uniref:peptidylprolyl isomerase n=1 Tax=Methylococcus sp. EFPC2 TaxID=2812648 RepID=UPI001967D113|nr:peptidylprolyl isomerase [Methylococcus sp. EFPC2]
MPSLPGLLLTLTLGVFALTAQAERPVDRIVAVVDDGVILESELLQKLDGVKRSLRQGNTALPPDSVLARQVLERLIVDKLQAQMAEKAGVRVDEETLRTAVQQIAQRNNMSVEEFRESLRQEDIDYADFVDQIRNEIAVSRLRSSQINSQIKISDREIQNYLETQNPSGASSDTQYLLAHILIATPQAASPAQVQKAKEKADKLLEDIRAGLDFKQASLSASDSEQALKGGELGWRKKSEIPSLFADLVDHMKEGGVEGPIRSSSGYHLIKLIGVKGGDQHLMTKTRVRHILIKPNEVLSDDDAKKKLLALKSRIENGDDFGSLARGHSDDKGSAIKAGELGWVQPGALVPPFEEAMNKLEINQLSEPVQTQFGWHLIQVLERQQSDDGDEFRKNRAREELFKRKADEETELWLRRIRDEAYVEIRLESE